MRTHLILAPRLQRHPVLLRPPAAATGDGGIWLSLVAAAVRKA